MPQETNLNVSPYFDDFDKNKNFYRVLFKPGSPVQARELSTLQSILQNQIEQFGTHFFKEGSKVIPGNLTYDNNFTCVQVEDAFLGISVSLYTSQLVGLRITGARSGVTATIKKILSKEDSDRGNLTFYIKYEKSGEDFVTEKFDDGESLSANRDIVYGASVIAAGEPFANTLAFGANETGSAMSIGEGVYFIRGTFAQVQNETLILDQYSSTPSYRVGFDVQEDFISADEDTSLNDNASGFTNFAAPGADRLQIKISLSKKNLDDTNDQNFVEISRVQEGELQTFVKDTQYNLLNDRLARRTYEESGDYYVKPFEVFVKESLNDSIGNKGVYSPEQKTNQGNIPSDDLMVMQISPGKAYVKGYSIEKIATGFIDVPKPRTTRTIDEEAVSYTTGDPLLVNNVFGSPSLGIGTTATVALMSRRRGDTTSTEVGLARLYDFKAQSASFVNQTTQYETRLFDIKTFTNVKVGTAITSLTASDHIEGARSGATGFVRSSGTNVTDLSLIDVNGKFIKDESIIINGVQDGRIVTKVDSFGFNDVKSLKSSVGVSTFEADILLDTGTKLSNIVSGNFRLSNINGEKGIGNSGIITSSGSNFVGLITSNNIVSYSVPGETLPRFNRITGVSTDGSKINLVGITSVPGVCNGGVLDGLIAGSLDVNDLLLRKTSFEISENSLLTPVRHNNIESLDVTTTTIQLRKQFSDITVSATGSFTSPTAGADFFFQPFDEERYFISYDDGSIEPLKESQVEIAADKKTVTFVGLSKTNIKANLFATVLKSKVKNKLKKLNEANVINITRSTLSSSGIGTNSLNDGLTFNRVFGTRVQDRKISLNVPDGCQLLAVFESNDSGDADLPSLVLTAYSGPSGNNSDLIVGEKLTGLDSNAVAVVVEKPSTTAVGVVFLNQNTFNVGETVKAERSGVTSLLTGTTSGDRNITNQYTLNINHKPNYYDFSFIQRKKEFEAPTNRLKVVFKNFFVSSDDTGDFFNASSYPTDSKKLISVDRIHGVSVSDLIDIRPRVAPYNVSSTLSPFDFAARTFSTGTNVPDPLVPDETLIVSYNYYQGRKDRLFLNKTGDFIYLQGVPSDEPREPQSIGDAIEVAKISMPPFVENINQVRMIRTNHKRFTMADIGRIEKRLDSVEYYTRLSLLETDTANLTITDANGLNRFKSGFFVDNFKKHHAHQIGHPDFSASTDAKLGYLRPGHYTTCLDLIVGSRSFIGIGTTANPTLDINHITDVDGENIKKTGRLLTLDYTETEMLTQVYASRVENVNPYLIVYYSGDMHISPDSDIWMDTKRVDANVTVDTSQYDLAIASLGIDEQTGFSEVNWGAWETNWTSEEVQSTWEQEATSENATVDMTQVAGGADINVEHIANYQKVIELNGKWVPKGAGKITGATVTAITQYEDIIKTTEQSREGIQYKVTPTVNEQSMGDRTLSRDIIPFMRKRNIEITTNRMKPRTRFYVYFDNIDVTRFITPKLLEVNMTNGVFQTGETVTSRDEFFVANNVGQAKLQFRLASPNHKEGPYNAPTKVLKLNPYDNAAGISTVYSSSSTILNVDTFSLATQVQGAFYGHASKGLKLIGETSGAEATITDVRLISDTLGNLVSCFEIPDPNIDANPRFETGTKTLRLTTSPVNSTVAGTVTGSAEANFKSLGELDTVQEQVLSVKTPQIERLTTEEQRVLNERITRRVDLGEGVDFAAGSVTQVASGVQYYDPLAQTFRVDATTGVFITSVDVFMQTKDEELPLTLQVRTVETGLPTSKILPFSVISKDPSEVNVSEDASIPTTFTFESPIYLTGEQEYALVLVTPAENYNCWISRMGEVDISTANLPDEQQVLISQQPYLGSLFKSQNGTTWDPSQYEDMKFTIRRAVFSTEPSVGRFFNSELSEGNDEIPALPSNPITSLSRKAIVGLGTTIAGGSTSPLATGLVPGVKISQFGNLNASANLVATAGIATINDGKDLTIINPGSGYEPPNGVKTYSDIPMITRTGSGSGAIGDVTVVNGQIGVVTFTNGGKNFAVGDTLGIGTLGTGNARAGSGAVISVGVITATNTLIIDNIQGSFVTGVGTIGFNNGSTVLGLDGKTGIGTTVDGQIGSAATITSFDVDSTNDGLHFKVNHRSHGMNAFNNLVKISVVSPDVPETKLTADYDRNSTSDISVVDSSNFDTFEGVGVGTTNYGYAIINKEIISYTGVTDGAITGVSTRGIDNTIQSSHSSGDFIEKYEFSGISLRRINKTHDMNSPSVTVPNDKDLDFYHIKLDMSSDGTDRTGGGTLPAAFFSSTKRGGGLKIGSSGVKASQNIQFETITPNVESMTPPGTSIAGRIRTISATSIGGAESSFADQGFQPISLNSQNHFETPRMIASKVNEDRQLSDLPGNKSLTLEVLMSSNNSNVSPVIDLDRVSTVLTTNRINNPVSNFATDSRVNQTGQDPCASTYVSNLIQLENPATDITVEFAAYRRSTADIRVFFKTISEGSSENSMDVDFELFPGFDNIDQNGKVINISNNSGRSDDKVNPSIGNEFKEYVFSSRELPPFTKFQIKIDMVGTDQAKPPFIKELRAIAVA